MWAVAMALPLLFAPATDYQGEGLKALEAYFAWRRTPEGEAAVK